MNNHKTSARMGRRGLCPQPDAVDSIKHRFPSWTTTSAGTVSYVSVDATKYLLEQPDEYQRLRNMYFQWEKEITKNRRGVEIKGEELNAF
ncbi:MAG: hypothetical protein JSW59_11485 [Phycisphaerales bacterium]|nr:MAG: hypothetical protein JSW59_11485 [Phycisphaerales bacterium]